MAVIAWLHCAWQGQGARLTSQKAAAPAPTPRILVPSCSLHRLHGLHRSHGLHRMALIAWLHRAWQGQGARLTSQAPAPTPRILVLHRFDGLHRSHGLDRMARHPRPVSLRPKLLTSSPSWSSSLSWPSSHGRRRMASLCLAGGGGFATQHSFRASGFATQHSFKGSGFCNPTLLLGLRVLQPNTPFRA